MYVRLIVHSREEARLYLAVTPCMRCQKGPHEVVDLEPPAQVLEGAEFELYLICAHCGADRREAFVLRRGDQRAALSPTTINPTDEPSKVIDLHDWLTLYAVFMERAASEQQARRIRSLRLRAGECLTEALKFYEDGDQPPPQAGFDAHSRQYLIDNAEAVSRRRILELRAKLPHVPEAFDSRP